ncbi:hypothetical protein CHARACLAT_005792 [Characodon lateralis]|uniref:Uncharacterized protein n=1 Tax=Characodon lateralis TaxID=208331 RepID=A0ABU7DNP3_9TELE|nr:hypothetical protein [Characodon lateralis]
MISFSMMSHKETVSLRCALNEHKMCVLANSIQSHDIIIWDFPSVPSINCLFPLVLVGSLVLSPEVIRREAAYTLDSSTVHHMATDTYTGQTAMHTHIHC